MATDLQIDIKGDATSFMRDIRSLIRKLYWIMFIMKLKKIGVFLLGVLFWLPMAIAAALMLAITPSKIGQTVIDSWKRGARRAREKKEKEKNK